MPALPGAPCPCCAEGLPDLVQALFRRDAEEHSSRWGAKTRREDTVHETVRAIMVANGLKSDLDLGQLLLSLDSTRRFTQHYQMLQRIGSGSFGAVYTAKCKSSNEVRAVKVVSKTAVKQDQEALTTELEAMLLLQHPNVLALFEFFEEKRAICFVMELCDGGDFSTLRKTKRSDEEVQLLFRDVFLGVAYCHDAGVAHRDLKMENALICQGPARRLAKVIDFGLSAIRRQDQEECWCDESLGTKYFIAPEVLDRRQTYGTKCDLWSLGVMVYIILTNEHPFSPLANKLPIKKLFQAILTTPMRLEPLMQNRVRKEATELLQDCLLVKSPESRMDAAQALEEQWLRPPGCTEIDIKRSISKKQTKSMLRRLSSFGATSKFERVILMLVAHRAGLERVEAMRAAFVALDRAGDGTLTLEELREGLKRCGADMADSDFEATFAVLDANVNQKVNYTEWLSATMDAGVIEAQGSIRELFALFDTDGNGTISRRELAQFVGPDEAFLVLDKSDSSKDGVLDRHEFQELMKDLAKRRT